MPPMEGVGEKGVAIPEEKRSEEEEEGQHALKGYLLSAVFVDNHNYFARPNNTGLVGLRHMVHLEANLYKEYLQFYTDQNFFSDRTEGSIKLSEWDMIYALAGTVNNWGWRLQYERDKPLDQSGLESKYMDTLITYSLPPANQYAWWREYFPNQNLTTYLGPGWLFYNQNYFARPDNTGRALFRYIGHANLDLYRNLVVLFTDAVMLTDRSAANPMRPSELDWLWGIAFRLKEYELSVYHEIDRPLDRGGLMSRYTAVQLRFEFEWKLPKIKAALQ